MAKELTGPQSFLRWAFPCAKYKLRQDLITQEDFDFLGVLLEREDSINSSHITLFERCFPLAVKDLFTYVENNNIEPGKMWDRETVDEVWQNHHGHEGTPCAVSEVMVCGFEKERVQVIQNNQTVLVSNDYNLPLRISDYVFVHWGVIIKQSEEF